MLDCLHRDEQGRGAARSWAAARWDGDLHSEQADGGIHSGMQKAEEGRPACQDRTGMHSGVQKAKEGIPRGLGDTGGVRDDANGRCHCASLREPATCAKEGHFGSVRDLASCATFVEATMGSWHGVSVTHLELTKPMASL
ncbi:hypothetical protein L7F22_018809 [Adiantum nelumboides]|nr:hypothetical protein [Adiantum nelumboides]